MLVLSRKVGEKLLIGSELEITVVEIRGSQIKLGITAPKHVGILRAELPATDRFRDKMSVGFKAQ